jgi:hypothetical protein
MPCERGQKLHEKYVQSVAARIAIEQCVESRFAVALEKAQRTETSALAERSWHVARCSECWLDPPRSEVAPVTSHGSVA